MSEGLNQKILNMKQEQGLDIKALQQDKDTGGYESTN